MYTNIPYQGEPLTDPDTGNMNPVWYDFFLQQSVLYGTGAPNARAGVNGNYYFRKDGSAGAFLYFKASGAWSAIL